MVSFSEHDEFTKEFKKLSKKWKSLPKDFEFFLKALKIDQKQHVHICDLGEGIEGEFYKVKKFRCASIARASTKSGIRIIYRYLENEEKIEFSEITFVEMYHKNQKENHDVERIKKYYGNDKG